MRFGIRLHVITRDTRGRGVGPGPAAAGRPGPAAIERAQAIQRASQSDGQRRMAALHGGRTDALEVSPNLWAGVGLVRGGAGTALAGSHDEVTERIGEYHELGIDEFILSRYPHLEEAYQAGAGQIPVLRRRGLMGFPPPVLPAPCPSRPLSFPATVSAAGGGELSLDAEIQVDRSDFGLAWNQMGMSSMHNTITMHAVFTKA